ncbi:MAG: bifunctional UDP-sugar hydrolase/5'-nucleotidase [Eubacteriales bacterium]|nr:bifunctional UDP-sugar hydrolase/5'-nucleotidase [Eubacteriales bacterium]
MKNLKKLTILHSNDMHGDFLAENVDQKLVGGVSMLSGYVSEVRKKEKNTLYVIAGDMFRGSVIDAEYKGLSTIEIMNIISPDVVAIGNHETDYGIAHLLFLEKCAKFPIINANLFITTNHARLFKPYYIKEIDGMKIMFIGIITEEILAQAKKEAIISSFIDIGEAAREIGVICNSYKSIDIDFTVILSHIGFEEDKKLAKLLDPDWGVDLIIGGHSHTLMDEPYKENGILIAQAGTGTDQIGRFDIEIDTDLNAVDSFTWKCVPINEKNCPRDVELEDMIKKFKDVTDVKYARFITRFKKQLLHPTRFQETELGNMFADILQESLGLDIMLMASGSIRKTQLGPVVTFEDLTETYPYDDSIHLIKVTGEQLRKMLAHVFHENSSGEHAEFYQYSKGLHAVYSKSGDRLTELKFNGSDVEKDKIYTVGIQHYHFLSMQDFLGVSLAEVEKNGPSRIIATSCLDIIEAFWSNNQHLNKEVEGRIVIAD